jgi:hypothetical protein
LYIATSAKTDRGVSNVFSQVAEHVLQRQQDAMAGRGRPIAVTMGAHMHLSRSPRRMRSLSPTSPTARPSMDGRRKSEGALMTTTTTQQQSGSAFRNHSRRNLALDVDEKKDDDLIASENDMKMAATPPSIMCDSGLLVCGSDLNSSGIERCIIL